MHFGGFKPTKKTIKELKEKGFRIKANYTSTWKTWEVKAVAQHMAAFQRHPNRYTYPDHFLYVSRKVLNGSKTRDEVKKYLTGFLRK